MIKKFMRKNMPKLFCILRVLKAHYINNSTENKIKINWEKKFNEKLNLKTPSTFNEKIQWLKLNGKRDKLASQCADKYEVRDYIKNTIGEEYLNALIGVYNNTKEINFNKLPNEYVLKNTHDSGSVLLKTLNYSLNQELLQKIECNLKINYGRLSNEWVYDNIKPRVIVENFLKSDDGKSLKDYKIFCFNGEAKIIQIDLDRFEGHKRNFYDTSWNRLDLEIEYKSVEHDVEKPELLNKMLTLTEKLSKPFNHVRIDWYISENKLIFGEMTFFHESGFGKFNSKEWELKMGSWLKLDHE